MPDTKEYMLYDPVCMRFYKGLSLVKASRSAVGMWLDLREMRLYTFVETH